MITITLPWNDSLGRSGGAKRHGLDPATGAVDVERDFLVRCVVNGLTGVTAGVASFGDAGLAVAGVGVACVVEGAGEGAGVVCFAGVVTDATEAGLGEVGPGVVCCTEGTAFTVMGGGPLVGGG